MAINQDGVENFDPDHLAVHDGSVKVGENYGILFDKLACGAEQEAISNGGTMINGSHAQLTSEPSLNVQKEAGGAEKEVISNGETMINGPHAKRDDEPVPNYAIMDIDPIHVLADGDDQFDPFKACVDGNAQFVKPRNHLEPADAWHDSCCPNRNISLTRELQKDFANIDTMCLEDKAVNNGLEMRLDESQLCEVPIRTLEELTMQNTQSTKRG
ncbi:Phosphoglucomutase-1 [Sesbania bispinosa]|nr:Phosphoglucomutase-1 [Sesbania bispinosa]